MIMGLTFLLVVLIFAVIVSLMVRRHYNMIDDDVVVHTTTVTTTHDTPAFTGMNVNGFPVVGFITRQYLEGTPYVIDPVDGDRMFLNTKDDIYEDGEGKWWGLK